MWDKTRLKSSHSKTYVASELVGFVDLFPVAFVPSNTDDEKGYDHQAAAQQDSQGHTQCRHVA